MITPIDLLKIAKERIEVNWEVYCANNEVICDNARELYIIESEAYEKAIKILDGRDKKEHDQRYRKWYNKYLKNKRARQNEVQSH